MLIVVIIFLPLVILSQQFEEVKVPIFSVDSTASRSANFIDINNDGLDDIFITNGLATGQNNNLFLNRGGGSFEQIKSSVITNDKDRSVAASFADADNDGDLDAVVVTYGANRRPRENYFYRNNGNLNFSLEEKNPICNDPSYSEAITWLDINSDNNLDVFITNSVFSKFNLLYLNDRKGSFYKKSDNVITQSFTSSRSCDWVDYNNDRFTDLFITNEENGNNELYANNKKSKFTIIDSSAIVEKKGNYVGSSWGDIDNDCDLDLFIATYSEEGEKNFLYVNNGNGTFTEKTNSKVSEEKINSFGSSFADVDNDGDLDLFVCNSYLKTETQNRLYINDGKGNFSLDKESELAKYKGWTFGCAFGDYNDDGWLDLILANNMNDKQPNALFKNLGKGNNYFKLNLIGTTSNKSAIGTKVEIISNLGGKIVKQIRYISSNSGYCSQSSYTVHFGLRDSKKIDKLKVYWSSGNIQEFNNIEPNKLYLLTEGKEKLVVKK